MTTLQTKWLKDRYEELMRERAKERTLQRALPETRIGGDLAELRDLQSELRGMPLGKRKSEDARQIQEIAAEIIDGKRIVRVGSGRGPSLPGEPSAAEIRAQVAAEANALWGRRDVTPRMVRSACAIRDSNGKWVKGCVSPNAGGRPREVADIRELAKQHSPRAIAVLAEIMGSPDSPPAARTAAASALLDRAFGKPATSLDAQLTVNHSVSSQAAEVLMALSQRARERRAEAALVIDAVAAPTTQQ